MRAIALALLGSAIVAGRSAGGENPTAALTRFEYRQVHMGVAVRLVVYAAGQQAAEDGCRGAFARMAQIDDIASDYRPRSELRRLCDRAGREPVPISPELQLLLTRSLTLADRTQGAFDITVGPFVQLWREARRTGKLPSAEALATARERVGWEKVALDADDGTARLLVKGMLLDLGGIAKGYAGDEAIRVLREHGIDRALFEAGGDIVLADPPPGADGWRIAVASTADVDAVLVLRNAAISTSGDTAQFVEIGGRRYSHVVDPRTGLGLTERVIATVIAPDGITADSLATAATVLGLEEGTQLIRSIPGVRGFVRIADEADGQER